MRSRKNRTTRLLSYLFALSLLAPASVFAQDTERLDDWFYSRLAWGAFLAVVVGIIVAVWHFCRLSYSPGDLEVNTQARRKYLIWIIIVLVVGSIFLLLDAWMIFPFSEASITFSEALLGVWLNYRTLTVLGATLVGFSAAVALTTRFKPNCSCKYAFLPGPRGK